MKQFTHLLMILSCMAILIGCTKDNDTRPEEIVPPQPYLEITNGFPPHLLSEHRLWLAGAGTNEKIVFAGGDTGGPGGTLSAVVDIFDVKTAYWTTASLSQPPVFSVGTP
jgi:hypothetical protein